MGKQYFADIIGQSSTTMT